MTMSSNEICLQYWQKTTMSDLPMLPSIEMRFSLFSRLSFRGLGQALLAVGDILSSCNIAEMFNSTRYSYQINRRNIQFWRLNFKLLPPETAAFKPHVLYIHNTTLLQQQKISTWERIIGIYKKIYILTILKSYFTCKQLFHIIQTCRKYNI